MPIDENKSDSKPSKPTAKKPVGIQRNFSKEVIIHHDCFKLEAAEMQKNMSWIKEQPKYEQFEHCHTFHSYDSSGKKQYYSTPIGGHFHEMELTEFEDGTIEAKCVSGPLKWGLVYDEKQEKKIRKPVPVNVRDKHKHKVKYLHSEKLVKRKRNLEAGKLLVGNAKLTQPPSGTEAS